MKYGLPPEDLGLVETKCPEMMCYQYLPIRIPDPTQYRKGQGFAYKIPERLQWVSDLLRFIEVDKDDYVYLTAKNLWASADNKGNRGGWHSDGFMTNDVNYIWYDCLPTEFAVQNFNITEDCERSLKEFEEQVDIRHIITYPNQHLLKLTPENIHRVSESRIEGFRTFVKISVSKNKYNLKGNSHNYLFDYDWTMVNRFEERNHPCRDFEEV